MQPIIPKRWNRGVGDKAVTAALVGLGLLSTACDAENGRFGLPPPEQQRQPSSSPDTYAWTPGQVAATDFALVDRTTQSTFNLRGEAVAGPLEAEQRFLQPAPGFNMFWFAMSAFYPGAELWHPNGDRRVATGTLAADKSGVRGCGGGRDCIPSLPNTGKPSGNLAWVGPDDPEAEYLSDNDLVLGVFLDGIARAYPHNILWWHEIANDQVDDLSFTVTFCPLTGSGVGFAGTGGRSFGVSGQLFNSNLVMYDHNDRTLWPQLWMGPSDAARDWLDQFPILEMTWGKWKQLYPETIVLSSDTGFSRNYQLYPYGDYRTNDADTFRSVEPIPDPAYPNKTMVFALVDRATGLTRGYVHDDLDAISVNGRAVINDTFNGRPVIITYERERSVSVGGRLRIHGFVRAFWADTPEGILEFDVRAGHSSFEASDTIEPMNRTSVVVALCCWSIPSSALAGPWVVPHGDLWTKQSISYWQTDRRFASGIDTDLSFSERGPVQAGDRIPFDPTTGGEFKALSLVTEAQLGLFDVLQLGVRLPFLWADFSETQSPDSVDSSFGLGDLWLSMQAALRPEAAAWLPDRVTVAARLDLKLPVGDFDPSIFSVPLTEGQVDLHTAALVGVSLHPYGYAAVEAGWRFRFENPDNRRDPGDEFRFAAEAGLSLPGGLLAKVVFDGVMGRQGADRFANVTTLLPRRRLFTSWFGLIWSPTSRFSVEADIRVLWAGEDFPTGVQTWLGASYQFAVF